MDYGLSGHTFFHTAGRKFISFTILDTSTELYLRSYDIDLKTRWAIYTCLTPLKYLPDKRTVEMPTFGYHQLGLADLLVRTF